MSGALPAPGHLALEGRGSAAATAARRRRGVRARAKRRRGEESVGFSMGKTGGKSRENAGKTLEKAWEDVKMMGTCGENHTNTCENLWENVKI